MAEEPVSGGVVGPTYAWINSKQFENIMKGDRQTPTRECKGRSAHDSLRQLGHLDGLELCGIVHDPWQCYQHLPQSPRDGWQDLEELLE